MPDDIFFESDEETSDTQSQTDTWIMFDDEDETLEVPADVVTEWEETTEPTVEAEIDLPEAPEAEDEEEIDLDGIFDELDEANKQLDEISKTSEWGENNVQVSILRDSLNKMEAELKKVNSEKLDLKFRNAELEAFWVDNLDPKLLSLSRVMGKAKDGDDQSKDKATKLLKDMLFELTWEDFDSSRISTDVDLLTQAELYNNATNPNLSAKEDEDEGIAL
jgi:hypothetical protein